MSNRLNPNTHVLLALRDGEQLKSYGAYLAREGFRVTTSASALSAWAELECERPDVLIIEQDLPWGGADGILAVLDEEPETRGIPVILLVDSEALTSRVLPAALPKQEQLRDATFPEVLATRVRNIGQKRRIDCLSRPSAHTRIAELQPVHKEVA